VSGVRRARKGRALLITQFGSIIPSMKSWFVGSVLFGTARPPVVVLFLIREHAKDPPLVAVTLWPTMLVMVRLWECWKRHSSPIGP
jgi:hypothetical protein